MYCNVTNVLTEYADLCLGFACFILLDYFVRINVIQLISRVSGDELIKHTFYNNGIAGNGFK